MNEQQARQVLLLQAFESMPDGDPQWTADDRRWATRAAQHQGVEGGSVGGIDDSLAQNVHARHAYEVGDLVWDRLFADVVEVQPDGARIFDLSRFHETVARSERAPLAK